MKMQPARLSMMFTTDEHGALRTAPSVQKAIDEMREENPGRSLVISGGDVFQGAPESEMDHGKPALELIPKAGYDVVALGNHDFDYGQKFLQEWTEHATYPILSSNVRDSQGKLLPGVQASVVRQMDGFKVGFIGVTTQTTPAISYAENMKGLDFQDPVPAVRAEIQKLREQGVDLIGLIAHTEEPEEDRIAAEVPGIDFILAGHTHEIYQQPKMAHGVPVYRSGSSREAVGKLTIELDPTTMKPMQQQWQIIRSDQKERHEGAVQELVDDQLKRFDHEMGALAGFSYHPVETNHLAEGDEMDQLVAQGIAREAGTTIGFHNQKSVRSSIGDGFLTRGDAQRVFPFPNRVQRVEVSYDELLDALRLSEKRNDHTSLFIHGVNIQRDLYGQPVRLTDEMGYELPKKFAVGTTDFIAGGGLGYFKSPKQGPMFHKLSDLLPDALSAHNEGDLMRLNSLGISLRDANDYAL